MMKSCEKYMYPFVESIRIENGIAENLAYHNERMNRTRKELFGSEDFIELATVLSSEDYYSLTKCRVEYFEKVVRVEYLPYERRSISSLRVVHADNLFYDYKSANRNELNRLFDLRNDCDDILIVRQGLLTDTFAANVALWNGHSWVTPAAPLLHGTRRASLLDTGQITTGDIPLNDISTYSQICLFNAMIPFGEIQLPIENVI